MLGGIFSILAAASFGFNNAALRRGVLSGSVFQALAITVPMGVPMFLLAAFITGHLDNIRGFPAASYLWLAVAGVMHFVWGRYCNYRSTKAIGGNLAGPWQQSNIIISLVLAILLLGETLTALKMVGIVLVVIGGLTTSRAKFKKKAAIKPEDAGAATQEETKKENQLHFEPNYAEGYLFSLLSAIGYGISPILIRIGLEHQGPGFSLVGGLISYAAAALAVGVMLLMAGKWQHVRSITPVAAKWFTLAGALVGVSQMLRYAALSLAPVTVVAPIQATSSVFRTLFGWLINREYEVFGLWVYMGILFSMAGAVALTLSTDIILANVNLPGHLLTIIKWQWP
jgi:uncharacterized membrane protein